MKEQTQIDKKLHYFYRKLFSKSNNNSKKDEMQHLQDKKPSQME